MIRAAAAQSLPPPRSVRAAPPRSVRAAPPRRAGLSVHASALTACALAGLLIATFLATCAPCEAAQGSEGYELERAVKAAFLYKFQLYVVWPNRAFASATSPFNICIVGGRPFGDLIDRVANGQRYGQHPLAVLHAGSVPSDVHCHIMYLATDDPQIAQPVLSAAVGQPELTVTDGVADGAPKGIINFRIVDDRVRFDIDNAAAARSGLSISSKLLGVALSVTPAP